MTPKEILIEAKRLLVEKGWCQNKFSNLEGNLCAMEAIVLASPSLDFRFYPFELMIRVINERWISDWNDHPDRTKEEVLAAFDKAIAMADNI